VIAMRHLGASYLEQGKSMNQESEECPSCKGTGVGKVKSFTKRLLNKDDYEPLECQHCNGTGFKPD